MPGLVPGTHVFYRPCSKDVDGGDYGVKTRFALLPGHDAGILAMHDIKWIRDNRDAFDAGLRRRGLVLMSAALLSIDDNRRAAILRSEQAQPRGNAGSKEIGG